MGKHSMLKVALASTLTISALAATTGQAAAKTSYLKDTKNEYHYVYPKNAYNAYKFQLIYTNPYKNDDNSIGWTLVSSAGYGDDAEKESSKGLYYISDSNGKFQNVLAYPIKPKKTWTSVGETMKITSVNKTIKLKAGTFKNVIEVQVKNKKGNTIAYNYYAKNVGLILTKNNTKKVTKYKLTKIKKK